MPRWHGRSRWRPSADWADSPRPRRAADKACRGQAAPARAAGHGFAQILDLRARPRGRRLRVAPRQGRPAHRRVHGGGECRAAPGRAGARAILAAADPLGGNTPDWLPTLGRGLRPERAAAIAKAHLTSAAIDLTPRRGDEERRTGPTPSALPGPADRLPASAPEGEDPGPGRVREGACGVQDPPSRHPRPAARRDGGRARARPLRRTGRQDDAAREPWRDRNGARPFGPAPGTVAENLARIGLTAEVTVADATAYQAEPFDAVLLDAPCSARARFAATPTSPGPRNRPTSPASRNCRRASRPRGDAGAAGRAARLLHLLPGARRGRGAGRRLPRPEPGLRAGVRPPE